MVDLRHKPGESSSTLLVRKMELYGNILYFNFHFLNFLILL